MAETEVEEISEEEISSSAESADDVTKDFLEGGMPEGVTDDETPEEVEPATGPVRDDKGRFVKKEETSGEVVNGAAAEVSAPPTEPEVPAQPFTVKVSGQEYSVDGAQYVPGEGLYIPDQHFQLVRGLIQEGAYYKQNWKQLESASEQRGYEKALKEAPEIQQAQALSKVIGELFENPEALAQAYENWATMGPMYREKAMRELAERQLETLRNGSKQEQEARQSEELEREKETALQGAMSTLKAHPDLKILTPEDWNLMDKQISLLKQRGGLFIQKEDGTYMDEAAIEEIAIHILNVRKQVAETAKKAEEAARFNALNKPKVQAKVPVASATPRKGSPPKPETPSRPEKRDVMRDFLDGKLDDDED